MDDLPADLVFHPDHEWVRVDEGSAARVGLTGPAVARLHDIVHISLPTVGTSVVAGDACGEIESTKAHASFLAPVSGVVTRVNEAVRERRELISQDPYGDGWLFEIEMSDPGELTDLLDRGRYAELMARTSE